MHVDLTTTEDVIQECYSFLHFKTVDWNAWPVAEFYRLTISTINQLAKVYLALTDLLVVSAVVELEDLQHDGLLIVVVAQSIRVDDDLIPIGILTFFELAFGLIDGLEAPICNLSVQG